MQKVGGGGSLENRRSGGGSAEGAGDATAWQGMNEGEIGGFERLFTKPLRGCQLKPSSSLLNHVPSQASETKSPDGGGEAGTEDVRLGNTIRTVPSPERRPLRLGNLEKEKRKLGRRRRFNLDGFISEKQQPRGGHSGPRQKAEEIIKAQCVEQAVQTPSRVLSVDFLF